MTDNQYDLSFYSDLSQFIHILFAGSIISAVLTGSREIGTKESGRTRRCTDSARTSK